MNKENLLKILHELGEWTDREKAHIRADDWLLQYIGDEDIAEAFDNIEKWYS